MTEKKVLVPIEQKQVLFYDDEITAVLVQEAGQQHVYVPVRPICEFMGLSWTGQVDRINRDPVLSEVKRGVRVTRIPGAGGGSQEMLCLPLEYLNGWLFGITASRVKDEIRDRLIRYQRECYQALHEAFQEGRLTVDPDFELLLESDTPAVQAYKMFQALTRLARSQVILESRLDDHEQRLESIEASLGDTGRHISQEQAMQISQAVKAVAMALSKKSGRNEYGGVYGELYRRFDIPGYKQLPARRFDEAMKWLGDWYSSLTNAELPF